MIVALVLVLFGESKRVRVGQEVELGKQISNSSFGVVVP